jgi:hypothetical protein
LADHRSVDTTLEHLLNVSPGYNITCEYISEDAICREGQGVGSFSSGCWLMARVTSTGHMLLRSLRSSVLQRQPRTSKAFHYISPLHICGRTEWRHYSTHSPEGFKNKSAVGVSHSPIPPLFVALLIALHFWSVGVHPQSSYPFHLSRYWPLLLLPIGKATTARAKASVRGISTCCFCS